MDLQFHDDFEADSTTNTSNPRVNTIDVNDGGEQQDCVERRHIPKKVKGIDSWFSSKKSTQKRLIDMICKPNPQNEGKAKAIKERKGGKQQTMDEGCENPRSKICTHIARWFYDAGIPANVVNSESFHVMFESISQFD